MILEKNIMRCLVEWGITKIMTITVDNASSNDSGVDYVRRQMNNKKLALLWASFFT
jgi:type IV pilus biogenesis protein CpaD/CtpE